MSQFRHTAEYSQEKHNQLMLMGKRYRNGSYKARKAGIRPSRAKLNWGNGKFSLRIFGEAGDPVTNTQAKFWKLGCDVSKGLEMAANSAGYKHRRQPSCGRRRQPARGVRALS